MRPASWNETDYVQEWLNKTRSVIRALVMENCPEVIDQGKFAFYAPSFAGTGNSLNLIKTWDQGIDADHDIAFVDSHKYVSLSTLNRMIDHH